MENGCVFQQFVTRLSSELRCHISQMESSLQQTQQARDPFHLSAAIVQNKVPLDSMQSSTLIAAEAGIRSLPFSGSRLAPGKRPGRGLEPEHNYNFETMHYRVGRWTLLPEQIDWVIMLTLEPLENYSLSWFDTSPRTERQHATAAKGHST